MKKLFLLLTICFSFISFGQIPVIEWEKSLGGSNNESALSIQQTSDGGYIAAGGSSSNDGDVTGSNGAADYWIVKLDATGNMTWQKSLGGSGEDYAHSIKQTTDGGYIVAGQSGSNDGDVTGNHGEHDYWIVKLDSTGNITWQKSLGGSSYDVAHSIQQTSDGGYIVAGESRSNDGDVTGNQGGRDYWIVKLDATGNITWQKSLGGYGEDDAHSIKQTTDGGYIVAGGSSSNDGDVTGNQGDMDYWIVKLDATGNITWQKSLGGSSYDVPGFHSIQQTSDGGYIVAGISGSNDGDVTGNHGCRDYWIVKLDATGNITWQKSLGGSYFDGALSIQQTTGGGYIVAGVSESNDGDVTGNQGGRDYWIVKLDNTGNTTWQKSLGGYGFENNTSIQQTTDGGYIVAGSSSSNDGDVTGNHGYSDYWIVKLYQCANTGIETISVCDSYTWSTNGQTYTESGQYTEVLTNQDGCDSTMILDLTIISATTETITECDSYTWITNGQTYTESGQYIEVLTSQSGCDSTITLDLTITKSNSSSESITECDSYTWSTNGQTYTESGQYTEVLTNQSGCDSTVTLNLTITNSNSGSETITECHSYTWNTNGQTYTESGQYTEVLNNQSGCDSTVTLDLTINSSSSSTQTQTGIDSYTWPVNNETYTESGSYSAVIPNAVGCDSTITLELTLEFTGLDENESSYVAVYPNPTHNSFILSTKDMINMNFTLLDIQGKVVLTGKIESPEYTVDISNLSMGQYNLVFEDENISPISIIKN
jgi:hypothetical protein